jgi:hypothetical protein
MLGYRNTQNLLAKRSRGAYEALGLLCWRRHRKAAGPGRSKLARERTHMIDRLIDLAFDTLGAHHLDVRVLSGEQEAAF